MELQAFCTHRYFKQASGWMAICFLASFLVYGTIVFIFEIPIFNETDSAGRLFLISMVLTYPIFVVVIIPTIIYKIQRKDWGTVRDASLAAASCSFAGNLFIFVLMFDLLFFKERIYCMIFFCGVFVLLGYMFKKGLGISWKTIFKTIFFMCTTSLMIAAATKLFYILIAELLKQFSIT